MSNGGKVNLWSVPENFVLSVLESCVDSFDQHKCITSNTLLVGKNYKNSFPENTELWINVCFEFIVNNSTYLAKRQLQVLCASFLRDEIVLSEEDAFNLMRTVIPSGDIPFVEPSCELKFDQTFLKKPEKAFEVKICVLNNFNAVEPDVIDVMLLNYFRHPRFLYKNDIFSIDVLKCLPELQFIEGCNNTTIIYFKVCDIRGPECHSMSSSNCGYIVDDSISLYQLKTQTSFVPLKRWSICARDLNSEEKMVKDFLKPLLPLYLKRNAEKLMNYFHPFLVYSFEEIQLKPFFLVSGPIGCGKTLLLSSVAKLLGLHYWCVECSCLIVGPSGFNEAKIKTVFEKARKNLPCLLQLKNIDVLGEDREGNKNTRIVSYFNKLITELKIDLPFIIVGTTCSMDKLSCDLIQSILYKINIDNTSLEERADAISWLCSLPQSTALKVAMRTSGFTLSDLTFLVSETTREKYKLLRDDVNDSVNRNFEYEDFVVIIDRMNAQTASAIGAPQVPAVAWTDVGGHNEIKKEIVRSLNTADFGTGLRRSGILLWGPPGTGKTLLAKAVANECKSTFLSVKGPELLNKYIGQSEQNVRQVFERAREAAPCIIFFDELDSLAPNRGKGDSSGVMDRVVSQLLSEMDGLQKNDGVFVLGATNRPDLIDPALLRPGRLDKMLYVGPCEGTEAKLRVLKALTRKFKMSSDVDLFKIAELLPLCLTGADIYSVCYNAWQNAARTVIKCIQSSNEESSETVIVSADDFLAAVENLSLGS